MSKINPNFAYDMYKFIHKPIREADRLQGRLFLERFLQGPQYIFEDTQEKILTLRHINNPATTREDLLFFLKDHVGFTVELSNITNGISTNDLRKLISLAVALWKQKGTDPGYANIIRLFTGKTARIFNYFDFRMVVGEKAFGEEQLGEDSWLISVPGVEYTEDNINNVVALFTFNNDSLVSGVKDRSIKRNDGQVIPFVNFYITPNSGFPQGSTKYAAFQGGVISIPTSGDYDLSSDFTFECFLRIRETFTSKHVIAKKDIDGKGFVLKVDTDANEITYELNDGVSVITETLSTSLDLNSNMNFHVAVVVDRTNDKAKMFVNGSEATPGVALTGFGDITNSGKLFLGGESIGGDRYIGDMDNFRLALNAVYDVDSSSIAPPLVGFIEYQPELLDEFQTDIRVVDEGDLDKELILRIINLMRPVSERVNVIFIRFFDDFIDGVGQFISLSGSIDVNTQQQMVMQPNTFAVTSVLNDEEFQDIVLQIKMNGTSETGGIHSTLFFVQDVNNYYEFRIDTVNRKSGLYKVVAGVETQIGADLNFDIVPAASYIFTVSTSYDALTGNTLIKTYIDSNRQHEVIDSSFEKGKFGIKTDATTEAIVDEIEMLQLPVDVRKVTPNFDL